MQKYCTIQIDNNIKFITPDKKIKHTSYKLKSHSRNTQKTV